MRKWTGSRASRSLSGLERNVSERDQDELPAVQKLLETENLREFTEEMISNLARELHDIIMEVRDCPKEYFFSSIKSKDAILTTLRNGSIELNLALDQLELKGKTPYFYKHLLACKEYLEKVFEQEELEVEAWTNRREQNYSILTSVANIVHPPNDLFLFLTQVQKYRTELVSLQQFLHPLYRLLNEEDEVWGDQCNRAISTLETMSTVIRKLCSLFDGSIPLSAALSVSKYEYMVTLYHIDEQVRKLEALFTSFRSVCRSTSKQAVKLREEIHIKLELLIQSNNDILCRLSTLLHQENPQKRGSSRHLRLVSQEA